MAQVGAAYLDLDFVYAPRLPGDLMASRRLARYLRVSTRGCDERLRELKLHLPPLHVIVSRDMRYFDFTVKWGNHPSRAAIYSNAAAAAAMMFPTVAPYLAGQQARIGTGAPAARVPLSSARRCVLRTARCAPDVLLRSACSAGRLPVRAHARHPSGRAAPSNAAWLVCQARLSDSETELSVSEAGGSETMRTGRSLRRGCRKRPRSCSKDF